MSEQKKRCEYCGETNPEKGFTEKEIIYRGRDAYTGKQVVKSKRATVCAGTGCGGYLQMGHEG